MRAQKKKNSKNSALQKPNGQLPLLPRTVNRSVFTIAIHVFECSYNNMWELRDKQKSVRQKLKKRAKKYVFAHTQRETHNDEPVKHTEKNDWTNVLCTVLIHLKGAKKGHISNRWVREMQKAINVDDAVDGEWLKFVFFAVVVMLHFPSFIAITNFGVVLFRMA